MTRLMGSDKQGIRENDTLNHKQSRLLRIQRALIVAYDNYQRGFKLQHQRGQHSSAFFKGTHQCAHQVILSEDTTFNAMYVDFTQYNQAIPSPGGMPVFEFVDFEDPASFFLNYAEYDTVTTPDFSGDRVSSYLQLKNFASHLQYFKRAFPTELPSGGLELMMF